MTLERCESLQQFMFRRWLRLFPAMLICSLFVALSAPLLPERPYGQPVLRDLLPGLTFIDQDWWQAFLGGRQGVIEGSFWTLFIEVKFYFIFGAMYFLLGWSRALIGLIGLFLVSTVVVLTRKILPEFAPGIINVAFSITSSIGAEYFGWFGAGALFYRYFIERSRNLFIYALLTVALSALVLKGSHIGPKLPALMVSGLFALSIVNSRLQSWVGNPLFIFFGLISYPLYLVHENLIVALTIKFGRVATWMPDPLLPVPPMLAAVAVAWTVAIYMEPWLRPQIKAFANLPFGGLITQERR